MPWEKPGDERLPVGLCLPYIHTVWVDNAGKEMAFDDFELEDRSTPGGFTVVAPAWDANPVVPTSVRAQVPVEDTSVQAASTGQGQLGNGFDAGNPFSTDASTEAGTPSKSARDYSAVYTANQSQFYNGSDTFGAASPAVNPARYQYEGGSGLSANLPYGWLTNPVNSYYKNQVSGGFNSDNPYGWLTNPAVVANEAQFYNGVSPSGSVPNPWASNSSANPKANSVREIPAQTGQTVEQLPVTPAVTHKSNPPPDGGQTKNKELHQPAAVDPATAQYEAPHPSHRQAQHPKPENAQPAKAKEHPVSQHPHRPGQRKVNVDNPHYYEGQRPACITDSNDPNFEHMQKVVQDNGMIGKTIHDFDSYWYFRTAEGMEDGCAAFVSMMLRKTYGIRGGGGGVDRDVESLEETIKDSHQFQKVSFKDARPGDIIIGHRRPWEHPYEFRPGHAAIMWSDGNILNNNSKHEPCPEIEVQSTDKFFVLDDWDNKPQFESVVAYRYVGKRNKHHS